MKEAKRDGFVFYRSFYEAMEDLESDAKLQIYEAITVYSLDKTEPELTGFLNTIWKLIKPQLDANWRKFENGKKGAKYGERGGRPKGKETPKEPQENPSETPKVKEKEKEKEKVNAIPTENEFLEYAKTIEIFKPELEFSIRAKFEAWKESGWKDGNNKPIENWKTKLKNTMPYLHTTSCTTRPNGKPKLAI